MRSPHAAAHSAPASHGVATTHGGASTHEVAQPHRVPGRPWAPAVRPMGSPELPRPWGRRLCGAGSYCRRHPRTLIGQLSVARAWGGKRRASARARTSSARAARAAGRAPTSRRLWGRLGAAPERRRSGGQATAKRRPIGGGAPFGRPSGKRGMGVPVEKGGRGGAPQAGPKPKHLAEVGAPTASTQSKLHKHWIRTDNWSRDRPTSTFARSWSKLAGSGPELSTSAELGRCRPSWGRIWPNLAVPGPMAAGKTGRMWPGDVDIAPKLGGGVLLDDGALSEQQQGSLGARSGRGQSNDGAISGHGTSMGRRRRSKLGAIAGQSRGDVRTSVTQAQSNFGETLERCRKHLGRMSQSFREHIRSIVGARGASKGRARYLYCDVALLQFA